jgi:hypothetical protein
MALAIIASSQRVWSAETEFADIKAEIGKRHDEAVKRLPEWIHLPSIAAENRGMVEECATSDFFR